MNATRPHGHEVRYECNKAARPRAMIKSRTINLACSFRFDIKTIKTRSSCFLSGRERIEADVANELEQSGTGSRLSGRERLIGNALIVCRERAGASRERELDELRSG
ncbi:hypothetical protein DY000_02021911 [Brassica cretica]|uniref:Uncharacterized protein n=1 Tax=Brassica cretica TaxID=69181 RepID=A0ABQ7EGJ0_BRACR|nr:hypothetical protein DY000_02021911 [Brassica cretica]